MNHHSVWPDTGLVEHRCRLDIVLRSVYTETMKLNEQRFLVLTALAGGPLHGYGLVEEIAEITEGRVKPRAGSLYHGLDKMLEQGLLVVDREDVVDGRMRRYYTLTTEGRETLRREARERQHMASQALSRLGGATA